MYNETTLNSYFPQMNDNPQVTPMPQASVPTVTDVPAADLSPAVKPDTDKTIKVPVMIGGVLVVVAIAAGALVFVSQNTATPSGGNTVIEQPKNTEAFSSYKDGTYYTEVSYYVEPLAKTEMLGITLVIENGKIKSASAVSLENGEEVASTYMDEFNDGIAGKVSSAKFSTIYGAELVTGSTLTSNAFKEALKTIEQEAGRKDTLGQFTDGKYSARIKYYVAAKKAYDDMIVEVTIAKNQITEVKTSKYKNGEPTVDKHTEEFDLAVMEIISGKSVDYSYTADLVSGSTLTSHAFQKALEILKPVATSAEAAS